MPWCFQWLVLFRDLSCIWVCSEPSIAHLAWPVASTGVPATWHEASSTCREMGHRFHWDFVEREQRLGRSCVFAIEFFKVESEPTKGRMRISTERTVVIPVEPGKIPTTPHLLSVPLLFSSFWFHPHRFSHPQLGNDLCCSLRGMLGDCVLQ